ncbi:uncharacterized protein Dwil_GK20858 [Drosophila willistoni]|uniref:HTH OST-type domain-containing protein n=1 Tax=Drosophila willistoni TaxID=7260 RepID=B4MJM2_DROWI|nr:uncharacterized protein Dwil_GK20858 [Drosophila willistoni]
MDSHGLLSFVKRIIHSLVVSTPEVVTIESLHRDYVKEEGNGVPYSKLGFRDLESFLRSISDTVVVMGYGPMARVLAVSKAQTAHIQQFVQCQKKPSKKPKRNGRGKPTYFYPSQRSNLVFVNAKPRLPPPTANRYSSQACPNQNVSQYHDVAYHRSRPQEYRNNRVDKPISKPNPNLNPYVAKKQFPEPIIQKTVAINNNYQVEKPIIRSNSIEAINQSLKELTIEKDKTSDEIEEMARWITNNENLNGNSSEEDVAEFQNDNWLSKEDHQNENSGNKEHDHNWLPNKAELNEDSSENHNESWLPNNDQINKDSCDEVQEKIHDWLLNKYKLKKDSSWEEQPETQIKEDAANAPPPDLLLSDYESTDEGIDDEDAIPSYAVDDRVINLSYPRSAVRSDYIIPKTNLFTSVKPGERIQVQLLEINNPHSFQFWIHDSIYDDYLAMFNNMQRAYNALNSTEFVMPLFLITTGHLCAVRSTGVWERACVVNYKPGNLENTIEVKLIDTGHTVCVSPEEVHYLHLDFAILPSQCLSGRLAYVKPWKGLSWSAEAVKTFFDQVNSRVLYAKVEHIEVSVQHCPKF